MVLITETEDAQVLQNPMQYAWDFFSVFDGRIFGATAESVVRKDNQPQTH